MSTEEQSKIKKEEDFFSFCEVLSGNLSEFLRL